MIGARPESEDADRATLLDGNRKQVRAAERVLAALDETRARLADLERRYAITDRHCQKVSDTLDVVKRAVALVVP